MSVTKENVGGKENEENITGAPNRTLGASVKAVGGNNEQVTKSETRNSGRSNADTGLGK
ncbi:hypothetical protein PAXRUDRAFT_653839 [Paxillus rubicundulus Ve08.2h10]|uniref:Uncharacterized protein n=1 Tax=Paxillus rubicundulus Ve08.2h10 TaxID=930991 RepID=A0A0D0DJQ0_9AGAM|nr:hypothetical protein PAXRUDRAFT_653839 [Paxillus rubicundulus Ve08.2h10]